MQVAEDADAQWRDTDGVYLRPDVKIEPLTCGWYAWTHLLSPVQLAMNVAYRQLPLLQSFVQNPAIHVSASRDRRLFGGPFVDLPREQIGQVRELIEAMTRRCARLIQLAKDIKSLDGKLQESANGHSLSEFYAALPESLAGMVECLYDINNHPRLRFHEELIYDENLAAGTSEIMLSRTPERERTFFMSTPRLRGPRDMLFNLEFSDERLDMLASMRTAARPFGSVVQSFDVSAEDRATFSSYFTREAPARNAPQYLEEGVRVRYFGHACVLIQTAQTSILLDPMLAWDVHDGDGRFTFKDLPDRIDYVVLSHNHQDHCAPEMLLQLRHRIGRVIVPASNRGAIADPSMKLALERLGVRAVDVLEAFDQVQFADGKIVSLPFPGEHVDLDIYSRHGIFIEIRGRRFAFLVDSDGWDPVLFRRITRRVGAKVDALFLGMECHGAPLTWLYGPLLTKPISRRNDESRRLSGLDGRRAWQVLQEFSADRVFVYAMGQEPWLRYIMGLEYTPDSVQLREMNAFLARCREANLPAESLFVSHQMIL